MFCSPFFLMGQAGHFCPIFVLLYKINITCRYEFFNDLYHRFLLTTKPEMKCLCLQAMAIVYGSHHEDIGPFSDTKYIVGMLDRVSIYLVIIRIE